MSPVQWTEEELAAMAAADAEIDAEFDEDDYYISDEDHRALDAELDRLAEREGMSRREDVLRDRRLARQRNYNQAHREDVKAYMRWYRQSNAAKISAGKSDWYQRNREDVKARVKRNYKKDPKKKTQYAANYYKEHRDEVLERTAQYQKAHRAERNFYSAKRKKVTRALKRLDRKGGDTHAGP